MGLRDIQEGIDAVTDFVEGTGMVLRSGKRLGEAVLDLKDQVSDVIVGTAGHRVKRSRPGPVPELITYPTEDMPIVTTTREQRKLTNLQPISWTWYQYKCLPQLYTYGAAGAGTPGVHRTGPGYGPGLYWCTDEKAFIDNGATPPVNLFPNAEFGRLRPYADNDQPAYSPFSKYGPIYVFAADWIGMEMNCDTSVQGGNKPLQWLSVADTATTDANNKIEISNIIGETGNKDWSSITHFATHLSFQFTNLAPFPVVVEVLFFKFKVDPHDLPYKGQCLAPMVNQNDMQSYCDMNDKNFGTQQIHVLKRKRFTIRGIDNSIGWESYSRLVPVGRTNTVQYRTKVSRKYSITRPVQQGSTQDTNNEITFFNKYYIAEHGIYCRMQAWPQNAAFYYDTSSAGNAAYVKLINTWDQSNIGDTTSDNLKQLAPRVMVEMEKKSYFKFDKPVLRGPFL